MSRRVRELWDLDKKASIKRIDMLSFCISYYVRGVTTMQGMAAMMSMHDNSTYRLVVNPSGVDVMCFGIESVDSKLEGHYDGVDDLPCWVQERLAVLMILDSTPPTAEVDGVGRRISKSVFWVYAPEAS